MSRLAALVALNAPIADHRLLCLVEPLRAPVVEDGKLPEWIHLVPYGEWHGHPTRSFSVTPAEADQVVSNFNARGGNRLVVDYEHQTLRSVHNGQPAPAAGWVDRMERRTDGVWGHVESWTGRAAAHLEAREYRYLSPVLAFDHKNKRSGEPEGLYLHSAALTNVPFLDELVPVVNSDGPTQPESSTMDELRTLLGLSAEATDEAVAAAAMAFAASLRTALALADDADIPTIQAALTAARLPLELGRVACAELELADIEPDKAKARLQRELRHSGFVPLSEHVAALAAGEARVIELTDEQVLEQARAAGKLTPAVEGFIRKNLVRDREGTLALLSELPAAVPLVSPFSGSSPKPKAVDRLSDEERVVCSQLGLTAEQYLATRPKEG